MSGWIKIDRSIQDHWIWQEDHYFKWWMTILLNVNYNSTKFPVNSEIFECNPGGSFRSIDEWGRLFGCSKKTVIKFFNLLRKEEMITTEIMGGGNRRKHLLTVTNWQKYQASETDKYTEKEPEEKPKRHHNKNRKESKNGNKINIGHFNLEFQELVLDWLDYKKSMGQSYKYQKSIDLFYRKLMEFSGGDSQKAKKLIEKSIANNWSDIYEDKFSSTQKPGQILSFKNGNEKQKILKNAGF